MVGYVAVIFRESFGCNQACFYENKQEALFDCDEDGTKIIAIEEVSSVKDICKVLDQYGFDGEYMGCFLQEDVPYQYMLNWKE